MVVILLVGREERSNGWRNKCDQKCRYELYLRTYDYSLNEIVNKIVRYDVRKRLGVGFTLKPFSKIAT